MKINLDTTLLATDAVLAAFILAHLPLELAASILFVVGFAAIVFHDYGRAHLPLTERPTAAPFPAPTDENLPLAS